MRNPKKYIVVIIFICVSFTSFGQYSQYQKRDTLKAVYPYKFPILGANSIFLIHGVEC